MSNDGIQALIQARSRLTVAEAECPHWDYGKPDGDDYECCKEMREAQEQYDRLNTNISVTALSKPLK